MYTLDYSQPLPYICPENASYPIPTLSLPLKGRESLLSLGERIKSLPLNGSIRGEGGLILVPSGVSSCRHRTIFIFHEKFLPSK